MGVFVVDYWDEVIDGETGEFESPRPLTDDELALLWDLFCAIPAHWGLTFNPQLLRSRWNDMVTVRSAGPPDRRPAFIDAAAVFAALRTNRLDHCKLIFSDTVVKEKKPGMTRLEHAKLDVINDFLRCFVAMGGFRAFVPEGRNYTGFLGGSRFREWAPVRTGRRP